VCREAVAVADLREGGAPAAHELARLVEAALHRMEAAEEAEHVRLDVQVPRPPREDLLAAGDPALRGRRPPVERVREVDQSAGNLALLAGAVGVLERALQRLDARAPPARGEVALGDREPGFRESPLVAVRVEHRDRPVRDLEQPVGLERGIGERLQEHPVDESVRLEHAVLGRAGGVQQVVEHPLGLVEPARRAQRLGELQHRVVATRLRRWPQLDRAREQRGGARHVAARERPAARRRNRPRHRPLVPQ